MITLYNEDSLQALRTMKDDEFDLAIVDPPYGIGASKPSKKPDISVDRRNGYVSHIKTNHLAAKHKDWDNSIPPDEYFTELKRVSKNQIIWGCNYFPDMQGGRIVWDKLNGLSDQYDCEIAYQSFNKRTDLVYYFWCGAFQGVKASRQVHEANYQQGNKKLNEQRIHPTQKPVILYEWLLQRYAKQGDKILDTHLGSGSIALACHNLGYDLVGFELDPEYYIAAKNRLIQHQRQLKLF